MLKSRLSRTFVLLVSVLLFICLTVSLWILPACTSDINDMEGQKIGCQAGKVNKIVDLWSEHVDAMILFGAGNKLVGVSNNSSQYINSKAQDLCGGSFNAEGLGLMPEVAKISELNPDLVIIDPATHKTNPDYAKELRKSGLNVANLGYENFDQMKQSFNITAKLFGGNFEANVNKWCGMIGDKVKSYEDFWEAFDDHPNHDALPERELYLAYCKNKSLNYTYPQDSVLSQWLKIIRVTSFAEYWKVDDSNKASNLDIQESNMEYAVVAGPWADNEYDDLMSSSFWSSKKAVTDGHVIKSPVVVDSWCGIGPECLLGIDWTFYYVFPDLAKSKGISEKSLAEEQNNFYSSFVY